MNGPGRRLVCVDDGVPPETVSTLREACAERAVHFEPLEARAYDWSRRRVLAPGDLLYRPATSLRAMAVEQALHVPGVVSFHLQPEWLHFDVFNSWLLHERAGLPVPTTVPLATAQPADVERLAEAVGGFPLVLKASGYSGGVGVVRVDSLEGLLSWARHVSASGRTPDLIRYVPDAVHWRVVVVGPRAVASYVNPTDEHDFRTYASEDRADYREGATPGMERIAVRALEVLGCEFGGVDLLEDEGGALWLLEANFPCYHAQAQLVGGIDVAGAMVDHLLAKAVASGA